MSTEIAPILLEEAKAQLRQTLNKGGTCPCCHQHVQMYSRPITSAMAYALILVYKAIRSGYTPQWVHAEEFFKGIPDIPASIRGDFSKLRFWDLIREDVNREGFYRITGKGIQFVEMKTKVESNVKLYNNKSYGFKGHYVDIKWCLKKKFNYELLMEGKL